MTTKICLLIFAILYATFDVDAKPSKNIVLTWREIMSCPNFKNKYVDISGVSIYMFNETMVKLKGSFEINDDMDTPIPIKAIVEKDVGGGKYMTTLSYDVELCDKLDGSENDWSVYINSLVPVPTACPITKNKYDVSNIQPQTSNFELTSDMIGKYKSTINVFKSEKNSIPGDKKVWACFQLNFDVDIEE